MESSERGGVLAIVLLVIAAVFAPGLAARPRTEEPVTAAPSASAPKIHAPPTGIDEDCDAEVARVLGGDSEEAAFSSDELLLLLPDPIDSGFRYYFDSLLEAADAAIEKRGFFRDRVWMPWNDTRPLPERTTTYEECRRHAPGVRIYRSAEGRPQRLVVFVVGETPTWGVQKGAIRDALERIAKRRVPEPKTSPTAQGAFFGLGVPAVKPAPPPVTGPLALIHGALERMAQKRALRERTIAIAGPTFSGTAASLRHAIEPYLRDQRFRFEVVSGAATGSGVAKTLGDDDVVFRLTTVPDADVECIFLRYVNRRETGGPPVIPSDGENVVVPNVAILAEAGTEFGATKSKCLFRSEVEMRFPIGISEVRDAYFDVPQKAADPIARRTYLELVLREKTAARERDTASSVRTAAARDLVLGNLLSDISLQGVRYVAIRATDVGDAIFLARKVRDVAPDVRLAFFSADVLLTHPTLRRELVGSYVISPYPFFGANDFASRPRPGPHHHEPFMNAIAEGTHNAVAAVLFQGGIPGAEELLATDAAEPIGLMEYEIFAPSPHGKQRAMPLPVWTSVIGETGLVPVAASAADDCDHRILGHTAQSTPDLDIVCGDGSNTASQAEAARPDRTHMRDLTLRVKADVTPPNVWQFALGALLVAAVVDWSLERRYRRAARLIVLTGARRPPTMLADRVLDLALGRAKYGFFRVIRRTLFLLAIGYMVIVQRLAIATYARGAGIPLDRPFPTSLMYAATIAVAVHIVLVLRSANGFRRQYREIVLYARHPETRRDDPGSRPARQERYRSSPRATLNDAVARLTKAVGFNEPLGRRAALTHSVNHLRGLALLLVIVAGAFSWGFFRDFASLRVSVEHLSSARATQPNIAIYVLRTLPLVNGVSPAMPLLLVAVSCYCWVSGRMARLRLAQSLSLMTPSLGARDAVCTPLSVIAERDDTERQNGLARIERSLANATWRPLAGAAALFAMIGLFILPVLLFVLKPPSTVEHLAGTRILYGGLGLCGVLIAASVLQLVQYWILFRRTSRRLLALPVGDTLSVVDPLLAETVERQIAGRTDDLLRLGICARRLRDLSSMPEGAVSQLSPQVRGLIQTLRTRVLGSDPERDEDATNLPLHEEVRVAFLAASRDVNASSGTEGALIGPKVILAASDIARVLTEVDALRTNAVGATAEDPTSDDEQKWLAAARTYVGTVLALILNRHVRQFRYYFYTVTGAALALLLAIDSYVFQPRRVLLTCIWVIMASVVGFSLYIYIDLDRSTVLSRISGTTPGRVRIDGPLIGRFLKWGAIPLLSVAAIQYPSIANTVFAWLDPVTKVFK